MFGMIVVLLVVVLLASDYVRRKKGLDYEEMPPKPEVWSIDEWLRSNDEMRQRTFPIYRKNYWGDPWGDEGP